MKLKKINLKGKQGQWVKTQWKGLVSGLGLGLLSARNIIDRDISKRL